jgi:NitT/TauT family transport system substrate-binding protein
MKRFLILFTLLGLLLSACGAPNTPVMPLAAEPVTLKIAVIPVIDTLPMFVAEAEGLYAKYGVKAELIPVASAPERDQLLQAGQADGTLNETLSVMFFNKDKVQLQVVRYGHMASADAGHFFILASAKSGITDVNGLKGVEIGISQGTIIEYVTDRLLEANGLTSADIKYLAVPKIPDRMALLGSGELKAAVMPDPLGGLAVQQGAKIILDDSSNPKLGASVISFRKEVIDQHPEAIKAFLAAIEAAVNLINSDPAKYSNLLVEKKIVPQPLVGKYATPKFPTKGVPSAAEWNDVLAWAKAKGLLSVDVAYQDSVNASFLP